MYKKILMVQKKKFSLVSIWANLKFSLPFSLCLQMNTINIIITKSALSYTVHMYWALQTLSQSQSILILSPRKKQPLKVKKLNQHDPVRDGRNQNETQVSLTSKLILWTQTITLVHPVFHVVLSVSSDLIIIVRATEQVALEMFCRARIPLGFSRASLLT
jgi:hypothetical protein